MKKRNLLILFVVLILIVTSLIIKGVNNNKINDSNTNETNNSNTMEVSGNHIERELAIEKLISLPYLTHTEEKVDKSVVGVVKYNPKLAFEGYNLYQNKLMDMEGNIVHSWKPECTFLVILQDGNALIHGKYDESIGKYSWGSDLIWEKRIFNHHEIEVSPKGTILIPSSETHEYQGRKLEFDTIIKLSKDGREISKWLTYENLDYLKKFHESSKLDQPISAIANKEEREFIYDYYHLNSIQLLPETPISKKDYRFQAGNWLLSFCRVNLVAILDKETKEIVWSWGPGELEGQHSPLMLDNGNILIYDNGVNREYTRVIELDPIKKEIVWEYKAYPPKSFFSMGQGYAQRLPNGNTLITESNKGRAFEITKEGEIVWEWFNPKIDNGGKREVIYRMIRYPKDKIDNFLKLGKKAN